MVDHDFYLFLSFILIIIVVVLWIAMVCSRSDIRYLFSNRSRQTGEGTELSELSSTRPGTEIRYDQQREINDDQEDVNVEETNGSTFPL